MIGTQKAHVLIIEDESNAEPIHTRKRLWFSDVFLFIKTTFTRF